MNRYLLAIDQGTTSTRAMLFSPVGEPVGTAQQEFPQHFPRDGWVEHDPADLWQTTLDTCRRVLADTGCSADDIMAIGISNQRETTLLWDRNSGEPVANAIVWQDRRTAGLCQQWRDEGWLEPVRDRTGLLLDPYFSATKLRWLLDSVPDARRRAEAGELLFGTVDTWLIWKLTGGRVHATDATNASRTLLFNIHTQQWDDELLDLFGIPRCLLPEVYDSAADFGSTDPDWLGAAIPIAGVAGDQQAALFGQACFEPGMCKSTYGTGCFMIMNTGDQPLTSRNQLLTTVAYRLDGQVTYALEGSIFMAGATMQWLRDGIQLIRDAGESLAMARRAGTAHNVYLVPAFTGLGAPHWDPQARGAIVGLTRDTGIHEVVTAGLQAVGYQTRDLLEAMQADGVSRLATLRVDGGMVVNDWLVQFLADILQLEVDRPVVTETTALGAAMLAALQVGVYGSLEELRGNWRCEARFSPSMTAVEADRLYRGWLRAVAGIRQIATAD